MIETISQILQKKIENLLKNKQKYKKSVEKSNDLCYSTYIKKVKGGITK